MVTELALCNSCTCSSDVDVVKDLKLEDKDKDLWSEDKDKDL